ncbi:MAG: amino acid ABC transporter permease [Clostridiales bacterium]|nr:amino acid ABC transporter permease [Clostridiales bacterium]
MFDNFFHKFYVAFIKNNDYKLLITGLQNTMIIAVGALIIGIFLGTIIAVIKVTPKKGIIGKFLDLLATVYITVIRGTPVVVQLLLIYFGILAKYRIDPLLTAVCVFGINSGAYVAEIIRSGILAVDKGQTEAGRSLGLTYGTTMTKIVLPQAIKNILPTLGNEFILLVKETSVAGFITVLDLTRATRNIVAGMYDVFVPYTVLALIYLVIVMIFTYLLNKFERWLRKSDNR